MYRRLSIGAPLKRIGRGLAGCDSVLGTAILPQGLVSTLQEELREEEHRRQCGIGEMLRNCIGQGELDHVESPEADAAHLQKVDFMIENLFSKIPLPNDPMKAALAPTEEELKAKEVNEVLKEAVREHYLRQKALKAEEEARIAVAMRHYEKDGGKESTGILEEVDAAGDSAEIRRQIEGMKRQVERLEKLLESKSQSRCP
ncbi:hypothetical protein DQ04_00311030 [Trypanosoma grayi]|uniref:hypothetical protein n=1 Tax=Trypanosoma grayi TaxID=71804 RepID=UPI0004F4AF30|nr:hypothetical protein DQ04_00311030 [Trypanosoma grayi]KEG14767.1 hypothetical protein DQ04_00311030 [Trypanosoma grayi]